MQILGALIRKELLLLKRDWHALLLLFLMPACFILIMSLAMKSIYSNGQSSGIPYTSLDSDSSIVSKRILETLGKHNAFINVSEIADNSAPIHLDIPQGFSSQLTSKEPLAINIVVDADTPEQTAQLFSAAAREAVAQVFVQARMAALFPTMQADAILPDGEQISNLVLLNTELQNSVITSARPTSVQQNVPAWLVFSMFFVALPISTTWLQERRQGTLVKLRSAGISPGLLITGKLAPYLAITLIQTATMLLIGRWIVPLLGGDTLLIPGQYFALTVMALSTGLAAVSYGLMVANIVSTPEQATILTGATNILLAAIGGVMVPRSVMPETMQQISMLSPMSWGMEGFLDILLRNGSITSIVFEVLLLGAFALLTLTLAIKGMKNSYSGSLL